MNIIVNRIYIFSKQSLGQINTFSLLKLAYSKHVKIWEKNTLK